MKPGDLGQSTVLFAIEEAIEEAIDGVPVRRYASDDEAPPGPEWAVRPMAPT